MNIIVSRTQDNRTSVVYMTPEDAELFKIFSKHHVLWKQLFSRDNSNTEIRMYFNGENNLQIIKEIKTFRK